MFYTMSRTIHTERIKKIILCVVGLGSISVFAQTQMSIHEMLSLYQKTMDQSAEQWLQKKYAKAKDGFYQAEDMLSDNMPSPSNSYEWTGCCALKTYTLLLVRMVEVDQHCKEDQSKLCNELVKQAMRWSDVLIDQTRAWNQIEPSRPDELPSRLEWMKRFQSAILRAQTLENIIEEGEQ